jgi:hypothetical protein
MVVEKVSFAVYVALTVIQAKFTKKLTTCIRRRSAQESAEQHHTVPERQQMQWMSFSQHLMNLQKLEGCFPLLEQKRLLRRQAKMVRKWCEFAKLIPCLSESKSAGQRLLAESSNWKSHYRAVRSVDNERPHLLPCEKQLADTLIARAGAIEDLRELHGCNDACMLKKVRSYALFVGVQSSHEDMKYNAEELCKVRKKCAPILPKPSCPNFQAKLSMKKGTVSRADLDGGQLQVHFAKDGYVISRLPIIKGGLGELPQEAARNANVHDGPTLVSWVNWNASVADYESRRYPPATIADDIDSHTGHNPPIITACEVVETGNHSKFKGSAVANAFQSDVYEQNRRTVAWAYGQSLARERRIEALCAIGRERTRSEMSEG